MNKTLFAAFDDLLTCLTDSLHVGDVSLTEARDTALEMILSTPALTDGLISQHKLVCHPDDTLPAGFQATIELRRTK